MEQIKNVGYHIIADFRLENKNLENLIRYKAKLFELVDKAVNFAELTDLAGSKGENFYAVIIAESHLILYITKEGISVDIYTCGKTDEKTRKAYEYIKKRLGEPSFQFYTPRPTTSEAENGNHILCDLVVKNGDGLGHVSDLAAFMPNKKHTSTYFQFPGGGASGVIVYENAYATFHTWPEIGLITLDFNGGDSQRLYQFFCKKLDSELKILEKNAAYVPRHLTFRTTFKI